VIGAPFDDPAPFMGPVIDAHAADDLTEAFLYLMSHGVSRWRTCAGFIRTCRS
jgi:hypothetical protein